VKDDTTRVGQTVNALGDEITLSRKALPSPRSCRPFAAIRGLISGSVPPQGVGSAMGFYQVVRSIGFSAGSALVASILAGREIAGSSFPAISGDADLASAGLIDAELPARRT
jgi:hypothetical protein